MSLIYHWIGFLVFWGLCAYAALFAWFRFIYNPNAEWFKLQRWKVKGSWNLVFRRRKLEEKIAKWVKMYPFPMVVKQLRTLLSQKRGWIYKGLIGLAIPAISNEFGLNKK